MTAEGGVALGGGGAAITPTDLNEIAGCDERVAVDGGAAMAPMPTVDVEPPARDCASATIVAETKVNAATARVVIR